MKNIGETSNKLYALRKGSFSCKKHIVQRELTSSILPIIAPEKVPETGNETTDTEEKEGG